MVGPRSEGTGAPPEEMGYEQAGILGTRGRKTVGGDSSLT